jgi:hypothetical protein
MFLKEFLFISVCLGAGTVGMLRYTFIFYVVLLLHIDERPSFPLFVDELNKILGLSVYDSSFEEPMFWRVFGTRMALYWREMVRSRPDVNILANGVAGLSIGMGSGIATRRVS